MEQIEHSQGACRYRHVAAHLLQDMMRVTEKPMTAAQWRAGPQGEYLVAFRAFTTYLRLIADHPAFGHAERYEEHGYFPDIFGHNYAGQVNECKARLEPEN